jgi:RHS repeat-associated protein
VVGLNNRTTSDGTYNYEYDAEGNRTARFIDADSSGTLNSGDTDVTQYEWDYRNRLTRITTKSSDQGPVTKEIVYTYDPLNRRIAKTIDEDGPTVVGSPDTGTLPPETTFFIYDGDRAARDGAGDHIALVLDGAGNITNRYLYGSAIDQILADEDALGEILWPLADNLGSVRDLVTYDDSSSTTTLANHIVYDGFGNITSESDSTITFSFGFTGRERDHETPELNYYRARYYATTLGQFIGEDPSGFDAGDSNLRRYVGNSSTFAVDPSGLEEMNGKLQKLTIAPKVQYDTGNAYDRRSHVRFWFNLPEGLRDIFSEEEKFGNFHLGTAATEWTIPRGGSRKTYVIKDDAVINVSERLGSGTMTQRQAEEMRGAIRQYARDYGIDKTNLEPFFKQMVQAYSNDNPSLGYLVSHPTAIYGRPSDVVQSGASVTTKDYVPPGVEDGPLLMHTIGRSTYLRDAKTFGANLFQGYTERPSFTYLPYVPPDGNSLDDLDGEGIPTLSKEMKGNVNPLINKPQDRTRSMGERAGNQLEAGKKGLAVLEEEVAKIREVRIRTKTYRGADFFWFEAWDATTGNTGWKPISLSNRSDSMDGELLH